MMKAVTCPSCGFKNFTDNPRCSRCNELLIPTASTHPVQTSSTSTRNKPLVVGNPKNYTSPAPPKPIPSPSSSSSPVPYSPPSATTSPVPFHSTPTPMHHSGPAPISHPPNPLPVYMAKLGPCTVEGEIIDLGQTQNVDSGIKAGDIFHYGLSSVLLVAKPIYGIMSLASGARRPKEFKNIYTFRVQTPANELIDVRVEKDMVGASINLRDYVSIWGKVSGGIIIMHRGYNHTVKGEVRLR